MSRLNLTSKTMRTCFLTAVTSTLLIACGGDNASKDSQTSVEGNHCHANNDLGIRQLPDNSSALYQTTFCKYLGLTTPNGKEVGFYAQQAVSDEQLVRAQRILAFYLTGKDAIANRMADNHAHMMLLKGADGDIELPEGLQGQPLYQNEMITEGSEGYLSTDFETYRDASFEEILHLMHDYGIGTESQPGADMTYSQQIKSARDNAMTQSLWPTSTADQDTLNWIEELRQEGSLSQEYLASVVDSYYGLWQSFTQPGGMWGIYIAKSRADIQSQDPLGYAVMQNFFQPNLTYMARIDASFNGTFSMQLDNNLSYSYKSQYLTHARLTGSNNSHLLGNARNNKLAGNSGSNTINGAEGTDTLLLKGNYSDYSVQKNSDTVLINDSMENRDGALELLNMEILQFNDRTITISDL